MLWRNLRVRKALAVVFVSEKRYVKNCLDGSIRLRKNDAHVCRSRKQFGGVKRSQLSESLSLAAKSTPIIAPSNALNRDMTRDCQTSIHIPLSLEWARCILDSSSFLKVLNLRPAQQGPAL